MKRWSWLAAGARAGGPPLFGQARYFAQRPVAVGMRLRRGPFHAPLAGPAAPFAAAAAPFSARRFQGGGGQPDHYKALGVAATASTADIKAAYKKLALQYHPDRNKAAGAEDRFKEISAAYSVLSNDSKRKEYDTMRQFGGMGGGGAPGGMGGMRPGQGFGRPGAGPGAAGFPGGGFPGMGGNQRVVNISKEDAEKLFAELFGGQPGQSPFGPGGFAGGAAPMGQSTAGPFGQGGPFGGSPFSMRNQTDAGGNQFRMYQDGDGNIRSERTVQDRSGNTYKVSQQVSSDGRTTTTRREQHFSRGPGGGAQNYQEQFGFKQHHQQQAQQAQQQCQQQHAQQGGQGGQQSTQQGGGQQGQGQQQGGQQQGQNPFGFGGNRPFDNAGFTFGGQPFGFQPRRSGAGYFAFLAVVTIVIVSLLSFVLHNPLLAIFLVLIYVALKRGPVM